MTLRRLVVLFVFAGLAIGGRGAVVSSAAPQRIRSAPPNITGTVLDRRSGSPIAAARVTLVRCLTPESGWAGEWTLPEKNICPAGRSPSETRSGPDGTFGFQADAGLYFLAVEAAGYVTQHYGQRTVTGPGFPIAVTDSVRELEIRLARTATICGRVLGSDDRGLAGETVTALRHAYTFVGDTDEPATTTQSGRDGEYCLRSLLPGRYYVAAGTHPSLRASGSLYVRTDDSSYGYRYFPGSSDRAGATQVTLAAGDEIRDADVVLVRDSHRITGRVLLQDGKPYQGSGLLGVLYDGPDPGRVTDGDTPLRRFDNGAIDIPNLPQGRYLVAVVTPAMGSLPMTVDVADVDVRDLTLTLLPSEQVSASVAGRWSVAGARTPFEMSSVSSCEGGWLWLDLKVRSARWPSEIQQHTLQKDGTFTISDHRPGTYRLSLPCLQRGVYVKDARLDGADALGRDMVLEPGKQHLLDIVLSTKAGAVDVSVTSFVLPVAGSRVVLAPVDRDRLDLFRSAIVETNNRVRFPSVAPGLYDVFAFYALEEYSYFDARVLANAMGLSRSVNVQESSTAGVTVEVAPAPAP